MTEDQRELVTDVWDDIPTEGREGNWDALEELCAITRREAEDRLTKEGKDARAMWEARSPNVLTPDGWAKLIDDIPKTLEDGATWKDDSDLVRSWKEDADALPASITCNRLRVAAAKAWLFRELPHDYTPSHTLAMWLWPPEQEDDTVTDTHTRL